MKQQRHLIGILGGLGPLAHVHLEQEILKKSNERGARADQDHPEWILASASHTPDRTQALLHGGESPVPNLIRYAQLLEKAGAACLFVACNTAHAFYDEVQREISIPWIPLMRITAEHIGRAYPGVRSVGVLATDGCLASGLYQKALDRGGLQPVFPELGSRPQQAVMGGIQDREYGVKATGASIDPRAREGLIAGAEWCRERGAQAIIAGCTEISTALTPEVYDKNPIIDPLSVAAAMILDIAWGVQDPREFLLSPD